jgi:transposase-like protein
MKASNHSESVRTANSAPVCPACKSASVTTTAKHPDVDSYWRCERCGEVWNVGRRHDRPNGAVRWR